MVTKKLEMGNLWQSLHHGWIPPPSHSLGKLEKADLERKGHTEKTTHGYGSITS